MKSDIWKFQPTTNPLLETELHFNNAVQPKTPPLLSAQTSPAIRQEPQSVVTCSELVQRGLDAVQMVTTKGSTGKIHDRTYGFKKIST